MEFSAEPGDSDFDPMVASLDLRDGFYQFQDDRLASWFGCEWPMRAWEVDITEIYDEVVGGMVDVGPDEWVYFVFTGLPMGWSWALFFC